MGETRSLVSGVTIALVTLLLLVLAYVLLGFRTPIYRPPPDHPRVFLDDFRIGPSGDSQALLSLDLLRTQAPGDCAIRRVLYLAEWSGDATDPKAVTLVDEVHPGLPYFPDHSPMQSGLTIVDGRTSVSYLDPARETKAYGGPITSWLQTGDRFERTGQFPGSLWTLNRDARSARVQAEGKWVLLKLPYSGASTEEAEWGKPDDRFDYNDHLHYVLTNDNRFWVVIGDVGSKVPGKAVVVDLRGGRETVVLMTSPEGYRPHVVDAEVVSGELTFLVAYQRNGTVGQWAHAYALHDATGKKREDLNVKFEFTTERYSGRRPWDPDRRRFVFVHPMADETSLKVEVVDYQGATNARRLVLPKLAFPSPAPSTPK